MYDGILELLQSLKNKGYKIGLATSKPEIYATVVVKNKGIDTYLDFLASATTDEKTRATKEDVIDYALTLCEEKNRDKIIMIGDRHFDINGAKSFGLDSIGVTFGYGSEQELRNAGATHIAHTVCEINNIL